MGRRKVEREMIEVFKVETPVKGALFINRRTDRSLFIFGNYERKKKKILEATGYNIYKTDKDFDDYDTYELLAELIANGSTALEKYRLEYCENSECEDREVAGYFLTSDFEEK